RPLVEIHPAPGRTAGSRHPGCRCARGHPQLPPARRRGSPALPHATRPARTRQAGHPEPARDDRPRPAPGCAARSAVRAGRRSRRSGQRRAPPALHRLQARARHARHRIHRPARHRVVRQAGMPVRRRRGCAAERCRCRRRPAPLHRGQQGPVRRLHDGRRRARHRIRAPGAGLRQDQPVGRLVRHPPRAGVCARLPRRRAHVDARRRGRARPGDPGRRPRQPGRARPVVRPVREGCRLRPRRAPARHRAQHAVFAGRRAPPAVPRAQRQRGPLAAVRRAPQPRRRLFARRLARHPAAPGRRL
ncbi:conserved hypothetical protein, partial [Ricinus communis]